MDRYELLSTIEALLYDISRDGSVVSSDVIHITQLLGGDPNVIWNNSDVTIWMTYMNTLVIRYLLQET